MIGKTSEYHRMYQIEMEHWWYKHLHNLVLKHIQSFFPNKNIDILDAGCGTGGLLYFLQQNNYTSLHGFDGSTDAIELAKKRTGLQIDHCMIEQAVKKMRSKKYHVICCLEVIIYLSDEEITTAIEQLHQLLHEGGIIILNNAAKGFKGTHDFDVAIKKRFSKSDMQQITNQIVMNVSANYYWNFLLSPVVWLVRKWKLFLYHSTIINREKIASDLSMPSSCINQFLSTLLSYEEKHFSNPWWGTSLLTVFRKQP